MTVEPAPFDLSGRPSPWPAHALATARDCVRAAADRLRPDMALPGPGLLALREQLARLLGCPVEQLVVTGGVRAAVPVLGAPLSDTVLESPTYQGVAEVMRALGHRVRSRPWYRLGPPAGTLWLTNPCRNPDGACLSTSDIQRIGADGWNRVVVNEVYRWHVPDPAPALPPGWLSVGSLNKVLGPGTGIGWIRGVDAGSWPRQALRICRPPAPVQAAWADFLDRGALSDVAVVTVTQVDAARCAFQTALSDRLGWAPTGRGPSLLMRLPAGYSAAMGVRLLARHGVVAGSGDAFGAPWPSVRLCFTAVTPDRAAQAAERVATALRSTAVRGREDMSGPVGHPGAIGDTSTEAGAWLPSSKT